MLIVDRQDRLLALLCERRTAQLDELAKALKVSVSTIRRDLDALVQQGLAERTHGGAIYRGAAGPSRNALAKFNIAARMNERVAQKRAIGRYAASLVRPDMTVLLDGGSTMIHAASQIEARPIQVVTNSLHIVNLFANDERVEVQVIGGSLYPRTGVFTGPVAKACLADLHADLLLFSLAGIYGNDAYNLHLPMAQLEQVMLRQAARKVMLMDAAKFGRKSLVRVCALDEVDEVVTDKGIDLEMWKFLGKRLVVADAA